MNGRLVLVTRQDLTPGYQAVQPAHALAEYAATFPRSFRKWQKLQKNLIVLSVANELALMDLFKKAEQSRLKCILFREPDIGNEATAIALEPHELTYKLTSSIPLALKEYRIYQEVMRVKSG